MAYLRGVTTAPVAPPLFNPWSRVRHLFHGWDGSVWDVSDGRNGVYLMPEGIEGMGMPTIENYVNQSPVVHGSEWQGWRANPRDVHWAIGVFEDSSVDWLEMKTEFWRLFRPGKTMRWEVILPNNERYSLTVRFKSDDRSVYARDPVKLGWAIYGITCFAEQPFWEGATQSRIWYPGTDEDWYGNGDGTGPDWVISSFADIGNAHIDNLGDVDAYMRWELTGPFSSATVGLNGMTTTVGSTLEGEVVILDTDPTNLTATRDGEDIMTTLGAFEYEPVPPGTNIELGLGMTGTGSIAAHFTPRYLRSV